MVFNFSIKSFPSPYLKVTFFAFTFCGIKTTSSCSTSTHSTGPIPSGKSKVTPPVKGLAVCQPSFQISGGLRHSSIVVQIENDGANSYPSTVRLDPSKIVTASISLNK